jgi:predicted DNA-binding transcriptional regulator YafY
MRADRLVAILLMLQAKGRVTAAEVAAELEISERTARRDLEALGVAGLPIYSQQGRNGGWQLMGGARTDLSGLTSTEARALFLVAGPASSATPEVKAALRKLLRALPEPFRADAEAASAAVHVDRTGWGGATAERPAPPFLEPLQHAVIEGQQVELGYVARDQKETTRVVHPLGLASKGRSWYLVADTRKGMRTFRVDRVRSVARTGEAVVRPPDFDLATAWQMVTDRMEEQRFGVWATGSAHPDAVAPLRWVFGPRVHIGPPGPDGRIAVEVGGHDVRQLSWRLAGFGDDIEVHEPAELRDELGRIGRELAETYSPPSA